MALRHGSSRSQLRHRRQRKLLNAMALRHGSLRSLLRQSSPTKTPRCHGLAPWFLTFTATASSPTKTPRCHGLAPWFLTFTATAIVANENSSMPWPCAMVPHAFYLLSNERETRRRKAVASVGLRYHISS